jgi:large subunit ribosomal protein L35
MASLGARDDVRLPRPGPDPPRSRAMPKQKTHSGAKDRFRVTKNGKVLVKRKNRKHLLEKKSSARKRRLDGYAELGTSEAKMVKRLLNK